MKQGLLFFTGHWFFRLVVLLAGLLPAVSGQGQGLFKEYDYNQPGFSARSIEELPGGGYRLVANNNLSYSTGAALEHIILDIDINGNITDSQHVEFVGFQAFWLRDNSFLQPIQDSIGGDSTYYFIKRTPQQDTLWTRTITLDSGIQLFEWQVADVDVEGNIWVAGFLYNTNPTGYNTRLVLLKLDSAGQIIWQKEYGFTGWIDPGTFKLRFAEDKECFLKYVATGRIVVFRIDAGGTVLWETTTTGWCQSGVFDFQISKDKRCYFVSTGDYDSGSLDSLGNVIFLKEHIHLDGEPAITTVISASDGGWVLAGVDGSGTPNKFRLIKLSKWGDVLWTKSLNITPGLPYAGIEAANHDLVWTGGEAYLMRLDSNGILFKNHLAGQLSYDQNVDCAVQPADPGIPRWLIKLENTGATQYAVTEPDGAYYFAQVDTGQQALTPIVQNYLWEGCQLPYTGYIHPDSSDYTLQLDAPIQSIFDCPVMSVDLATPFLRRCFNNTYAIQCCNYGNQTADSAYVELYLPPHLLVQSASAPFVQNGLTLRFDLGAVEPFECIDLQLVVKPDCDSTEIGQAMCVSAHIFPDTLCGTIPGWSGALIEVSAACDGDSVRFDIRNTGSAPTSQSLDFIVIDDHVMTLQSSFNLAAQESHTEAFPADGSTWRILAEQEPNAPGAAIPSVAVEGCLAAGNGPFNTGFIIQWPNENGSPFWERDCHEIVGSFDPNAKQAAPAGVDAQHWIKPNTPIEYLIQFQNTGTDTAFTVELRDTLSPGLQAESIRPGAASHPYSWSLSGAGVLRFLFENILLPDSNTNAPASQGFVKFRIAQQPDLPDGTLLENSAAIYFDFNEPVLTNTTFHTVGRDFLPTVNVQPEPGREANLLTVFPNPARERAVVFLKNKNRMEGRFTLFDAYGREVWTEPSNSATFELRRRGLPAGLYWLRWTGKNGEQIFSKLSWQ